MSTTLNFDGQTTATIRIGTNEIILRGRLSGNPPKKLALVYHAQKLEEAIYLGTPAKTMQELARFLNFAGDATDQLKDFQKEFKSKLQSIVGNGVNFPDDEKFNFLKKLQDILKHMAGLTNLPPDEIDIVTVWVTDVVFKGDVYPASDKLPPGEITLGLAFEFKDMKLLNIELLSAGIQFTATIS